MRLMTSSLLVGAAVLGLGALALPASGKEPATHEMTIQLPNGGTETIRYTGDVAPKVTFVQAPFAVAWPAPVAFGFVPSFAALDRIAADMDRQMDAFWRQAQTVTSWSGNDDLSQAALQNLVPGFSAYSVVSQSFGDKVCTRMTQITSSPNGGKPKVVSRTSGNCDASPTGAGISPSPTGARTIADHHAIPATSVSWTAL
jgi:hypothetical protein